LPSSKGWREGALTSIYDIASKSVVTVNPYDSLALVRELMIKHSIGRVVVVDGGRPVGIITKKDVVRFLAADDSDRSLIEIPASEVMSVGLITVKPDVDVKDASKLMLKRGVSSLLVVGEGGGLMGIATKTDVCRYYGEMCRGLFKVRDFMSRDVIYVKPLHSMFRVMNLMVKHNISRVVVVDEEFRPIGIVTSTDLTFYMSSLKPVKHAAFESLPSSIIMTAEDVMTKNPLTIGEDEDLSEASRVMVDRRISGLPVTGVDGRLTGIVTKTDIVKATASIK